MTGENTDFHAAIDRLRRNVDHGAVTPHISREDAMTILNGPDKTRWLHPSAIWRWVWYGIKP